MQVASAALEIVQAVDAYEFAKEIEDLSEDVEDLEEDAEMWESEMRFSYGESYSMNVRNGPEADPYEYMNELYKDVRSYDKDGFL